MFYVKCEMFLRNTFYISQLTFLLEKAKNEN